MLRTLIISLLCFIFVTFDVPCQDSRVKWKCQVGTGLGNCGPTCIAMAVSWAKCEDVYPQKIREIMGYKRDDGSTTLEELFNVMLLLDVKCRLKEFTSLELLKFIAKDRNKIAIVCLTLKFVDISKGDSFGRNHNYEEGHYIIIEDFIGDYFICQDPMPNGSNRYYLVEQVWMGMKCDNVKILVVSKY
jgi:hypothetical protein